MSDEADVGTPEVAESTDRIKAAGLANGAVVVGVAAASAFNDYVPAGHRPEDFLPGARSVVVAGSLGPSNAAVGGRAQTRSASPFRKPSSWVGDGRRREEVRSCGLVAKFGNGLTSVTVTPA